MSKRVFKTTKKLSHTRCAYRKWSEWEVGDIVVGKYVGSKIDNYKKPNWMLEVEEAFFANKKEAKAMIGQTIGLNSSGTLDKAMEKATEGKLYQITYNGTEEMTGGPYAGKDRHLIEVDECEVEGEHEYDDDEAETDEDSGDDL